MNAVNKLDVTANLKTFVPSFVLLSILMLSGCTSIYLDTSDSLETIDEFYFGAVRVSYPKQSLAENQTVSLEIETMGVWLVFSQGSIVGAMPEAGVGIGYKDMNRLVLPKTCQLVIFVADEETLANALKVLKLEGTQGEKICTVQKLN